MGVFAVLGDDLLSPTAWDFYVHLNKKKIPANIIFNYFILIGMF